MVRVIIDFSCVIKINLITLMNESQIIYKQENSIYCRNTYKNTLYIE